MAFDSTSVPQALALMGSSKLMPTVSFGWLLYPVSALSSLLSTGRLSPVVDVDSMVINVKSGYARKNKSWVLGRFLQDWDYKPTTVKGLYITIIDAVTEKEQVASYNRNFNMICWVSLATFFLQTISAALCISSSKLPALVLMLGFYSVTAINGLPQWNAEKFSCRKGTHETYCLTSGNGSAHAIIIRGNGVGLDLEDLAANRTPQTDRRTYVIIIMAYLVSIMMLLFIALDGLGASMSAILLLGTINNILIAGAPRSAATHGFHVKESKKIHDDSVIKALASAEEHVSGAGFAMLPIFFPGRTRSKDIELLEEAKAKRESLEGIPSTKKAGAADNSAL